MNHEALMRNIDKTTFSDLFQQLRSEKDPRQRHIMSQSLSESLMAIHGFNAYYEYLNSVSEDSNECMILFCKVIFSKPSNFDTHKDYLLASKQNLAEFVEFLLSSDIESDLRTFTTNFFYFLRRSSNIDFFDCYFDLMNPESVELYYHQLCSWEFYTEDLCEFYSKYLKYFMNIFLNSDLASKNIQKCLISSIMLYDFEKIVELLSNCPRAHLMKIIKLWSDDSRPLEVIEACIYITFPENYMLLEFGNSINCADLSSKFKKMLRLKADSTNFDPLLWGNFFAKFDGEGLDLKADSNISNVSEANIGNVISNLKSSEAAEIAYGLHILRNNTNLVEEDINIVEIVVKQLLHEDSYVYMNAIKTITSLGKVNQRLICKHLLNSARENIRANNSLNLVRFVEIYNEIMPELLDDANDSKCLEDFASFSAIYLRSPEFELRCSLLTFFLHFIESNFLVFSKIQFEFWGALNLNQVQVDEFDLESEILFKLLNSYILSICRFSRKYSTDKIIYDISVFFEASFKSSSKEISAMAYNGKIQLENLRKINIY